MAGDIILLEQVDRISRLNTKDWEQLKNIIARKDHEDRRCRQAQGVQRAKQKGKYKGRPVNINLHQKIEGLLREGKSYSQIEALIKFSRHTISKIYKLLKTDKTSCQNHHDKNEHSTFSKR